jgi:hypothetical protein
MQILRVKCLGKVAVVEAVTSISMSFLPIGLQGYPLSTLLECKEKTLGPARWSGQQRRDALHAFLKVFSWYSVIRAGERTYLILYVVLVLMTMIIYEHFGL